jgi:5-methylcytosine-specific restriction enzyme A
MRARKICSHNSCPNLQPCPTHPCKPWAGSAYHRNDRSTLSGSRRQKRARFVISRDDTCCWLCGLPGATEADHVIPLSAGGADDASNMRAAHHDCHLKKSLDEAHGGRTDESQPKEWGSGPDAKSPGPLKAGSRGARFATGPGFSPREGLS